MFEKNLGICDLFDRYEPVLSPRHRELLSLYYNEDLSLAEIAAEIGISRQGVRDGIKKAEEELFFLEERLHLDALARRAEAAAERLLALPLDGEARAAAQALCEAIGIKKSEN